MIVSYNQLINSFGEKCTMLTNYKILDIYVENKKLTYQEFGEIVGVHWRTLYGIIKGLSPAGKKASRKIDKWFQDNQGEILSTISDKEPVKT